MALNEIPAALCLDELLPLWTREYQRLTGIPFVFDASQPQVIRTDDSIQSSSVSRIILALTFNQFLYN